MCAHAGRCTIWRREDHAFFTPLSGVKNMVSPLRKKTWMARTLRGVRHPDIALAYDL
jgi:hypothetical protein